MLWFQLLRPPYLISSIIKITDVMQSTTSKYFGSRDLANMLSLVPISIASQWQFLREAIHLFQDTLQSTSTALPLHAIFTDNILTASTFPYWHKYDITVMTFSSKEFYLTCSLRTLKSTMFQLSFFAFWKQHIPHLDSLLNLSDAAT